MWGARLSILDGELEKPKTPPDPSQAARKVNLIEELATLDFDGSVG